jgi:kynureninase
MIAPPMVPSIDSAFSALGNDPFTEENIARHIAPLFSRVLAADRSNNGGPDRIYLENHSLGRAPDQTIADVSEAVALWYSQLGDAWDTWLAEREAFRARLATIFNAPRPDCVIPRTSAGAGLRAILNALATTPATIPHVLSTRGEFDSVDITLKQYASKGRITVDWIAPAQPEPASIEPGDSAIHSVDRIIAAIRPGTTLVVVSHIFFSTGQILTDIPRLAEACHAAGALLLVDAYHSIGVIPVDVVELDCDFLIGGSYKYLRGGPGAAFFYIAPRIFDAGISPLDTGWFANASTFAFERPDPPQLASGGDAFLLGTPPVLTWYQARAGQRFVRAASVERLRAYSLRQKSLFSKLLAEQGITARAAGESHGAFLIVADSRVPRAEDVVRQLSAKYNVHADARGPILRLCPDCLNREEELVRAASAIGAIYRSF